MKVLLTIYLILIPISLSFSYELGGAFSLDYYNNPVVNSAPSPLQKRLMLLHSFTRKNITFRSGLGLSGAYYQVIDDIPVFNDYFSGFKTLEIDIFTYPSYIFYKSDKYSLGLSAGGGFRIPIVSSIDEGVNPDKAFLWFYKDFNFLFVGGSIYTKIKLPLGDNTTKLLFSLNYNNFIARKDHWTIGATAGMLWQFN